MGRRGKLERLATLHEDQERSRELREKALKHLAARESKKTKAPGKDKNGQKRSTPIRPLVLDEALIYKVRANAGLFLDGGEDNPLVPVRAAEAYIELAALLTQAAAAPGIYLSLCWPVGFEWAGLAHALASHTLAAANHGEHGLRMALYPALHSNYGRYRSTRFPMQHFLSEARNAYTPGVELGLRHRAFLHLNQLEESQDRRRHPALDSSIALFEWSPDDESWSYHGQGYFRDVRLALHHVSIRTSDHKRQIGEYAELMEDPDRASEAVFRIMRKCTPSQARECLLRNQSKMDLIVIDGRQHLLTKMPSWRNAMETLIEQIGKREEAPSLVLLTDDVTISQVFLAKLKASGKKGKKSAPTKPVYLHHWLRAEAQIWRGEVDPPALYAPWSSFNARVTAARSLIEIGKINEIAQTVKESSPELARELRRAGGFLRRLVSMPVGQRPLQQQLHEQAKQMPLSEGTRLLARYYWNDYVREMRARLGGTSAGDSPSLERALKLAQGVFDHIVDSTGVQRELLDVLMEKVVEEKRTQVLVEDQRLITSLHAIIQAELGEAQDGLVQIHTNIDTVCAGDVDALVVAGARKERVLRLLVSDGLPDDFSLILDAYSGWQVQKDLGVLEGMDAYAPIRPRIEALLNQLRPPIQSFLKLAGDLEIPAEIAEDGQGGGGHYDHASAYANIHLDGYGILPVGKASTLIRFNPVRPPPFLATTVDDLTEGDRLVILDDNQRDQIANLLQVQTSRLIAKAEDVLKFYFQQALTGIKENFRQPHSAKRARAILARMGQIDADLALAIPEERVACWVRHIEKFDPLQVALCQRELKSGSPRHKEEFMLFAEAVGMHPLVAVNYWQEGIWRLRVLRILEGRKLGRQIQRVLTGFISLTELGLGREETEALFDLARSQVYPISMIICINAEHGNEGSRS